MKIDQSKTFSPVTLVLETQEEFNYLYALSNSSVTTVRKGAEGLDIILDDDFEKVQMNLFNRLKEINS